MVTGGMKDRLEKGIHNFQRNGKDIFIIIVMKNCVPFCLESAYSLLFFNKLKGIQLKKLIGLRGEGFAESET